VFWVTGQIAHHNNAIKTCHGSKPLWEKG